MFTVKTAGLLVCDLLYLLKLFCAETGVPLYEKNNVLAGNAALKKMIPNTHRQDLGGTLYDHLKYPPL